MQHKILALIGLLGATVVALLLAKAGNSNRISVDSGSPQYIAFSLKQAEALLRKGSCTDTKVEALEGITRIIGCVYDAAHSDPLIVGVVVPGEAPITLSDLSVAIQARALRQWPLVSIDSTPETPTSGLQKIRFEGGPSVGSSQLGSDLLAADIQLKTLGFDGAPGLVSYMDRTVAQAEANPDATNRATKLFFVPQSTGVAVRKDVIAIQEIAIGVQVRTLNASENDPAGEAFGKDLANRYAQISATNRPIARLRTLFELAGLAEGMRNLQNRPNLTYWQQTYRITPVKIDTTYPLLKRSRQLRGSGPIRHLTMDGGIELKALVSSLRDQDVTALRDLVLRSRPAPDSLWFPVPLQGWKVMGPPLPRRPICGRSRNWSARSTRSVLC